MPAALVPAAATPTPLRTRLRRINWSLTLGAAVILTALLVAALAPYLAPHDPFGQNLALRLLPPSWAEGGNPDHLLGTDQLGRDYFSRLIHGSRISLGIGFAVAFISGLVGITLGTLAGFYGGRIDTIVTYLITVRLAMPTVIVALSVVAIIGNSLQTVIVVLGLLLWDQFAIVARSAARAQRAKEYVDASRSMGASQVKIILRDIVPNILPTVAVVAAVEAAGAIMVEAALSFLGLGVQPPAPSWGLMMAESKETVFFSSWLILFPGLALFVLVLAVNMLGDGLRDVFAKGEAQ